MSESSAPTLTNERVQLLRTIHQNHVQLSSIADQKASVLVAAALLVLAIIFVNFDAAHPSITLIVLAAFTLASACFATFSILPRSRPEAGRAHKFNLFFFGSFAQLSEREFTTSLMNVIHKDGPALEAMIHDIYQLGTFLYLRKYRFLRLAYVILLVGLGCTGLTWFIELLTSGKG